MPIYPQPWISKTFNISAFALRDLGLRDAEDPEIFAKGLAYLYNNAVGMSTIKERRIKEIEVSCHPKTMVGQYVTLEFIRPNRMRCHHRRR